MRKFYANKNLKASLKQEIEEKLKLKAVRNAKHQHSIRSAQKS